MLMQWLGGESRSGLLLRAACVLIGAWMMMFLLAQGIAQFALSDASTDYLHYVRQQVGGTGWWYQAAAELPIYVLGLIIGLAAGLSLALIFEYRPLRVAVATAVLVAALAGSTLFDGDAADAPAQLRFMLLGLCMAAGVFVVPWLLQRRRARAVSSGTAV
jgi:hypothetical protein